MKRLSDESRFLGRVHEVLGRVTRSRTNSRRRQARIDFDFHRRLGRRTEVYCALTMSVIFCVDNRNIHVQSRQSFFTESSFASAHQNVSALLTKYISLSRRQLCLLEIESILIAKSPDSVQIIPSGKCRDIFHVEKLLQPRFTSLGGHSIPSYTWSHYLRDALDKATSAIIQHKRQKQAEYQKSVYRGENITFENKFSSHQFLIFSNDISLLGGNSANNIELGLRDFAVGLQDMQRALKLYNAEISIRIVCILVSSPGYGDTSAYYDNSNYITAHRFFKHFNRSNKDKDDTSIQLSFSHLMNHSYHFDEELRTVLRTNCSIAPLDTHHLYSPQPQLHSMTQTSSSSLSSSSNTTTLSLSASSRSSKPLLCKIEFPTGMSV